MSGPKVVRIVTREEIIGMKRNVRRATSNNHSIEVSLSVVDRDAFLIDFVGRRRDGCPKGWCRVASNLASCVDPMVC
jgi:hypothetical protein